MSSSKVVRDEELCIRPVKISSPRPLTGQLSRGRKLSSLHAPGSSFRPVLWAEDLFHRIMGKLPGQKGGISASSKHNEEDGSTSQLMAAAVVSSSARPAGNFKFPWSARFGKDKVRKGKSSGHLTTGRRGVQRSTCTCDSRDPSQTSGYDRNTYKGGKLGTGRGGPKHFLASLTLQVQSLPFMNRQKIFPMPNEVTDGANAGLSTCDTCQKTKEARNQDERSWVFTSNSDQGQMAGIDDGPSSGSDGKSRMGDRGMDETEGSPQGNKSRPWWKAGPFARIDPDASLDFQTTTGEGGGQVARQSPKEALGERRLSKGRLPWFSGRGNLPKRTSNGRGSMRSNADALRERGDGGGDSSAREGMPAGSRLPGGGGQSGEPEKPGGVTSLTGQGGGDRTGFGINRKAKAAATPSQNSPQSKLREWVEQLPFVKFRKRRYPDKQKLSSVQDFFQYTEEEGRKLFDELDGDGDGHVGLEDLEAAMLRRKLPRRYARAFLRRVRKNWLAKTFGWEEFLQLMEQKEPAMLRAFTSLHLNASGALQRTQVLASLKKAGLPATEDNARAMLRALDADSEEGQVAYGQFRNFMLLLPPERLAAEPSMVWFEAATVVPMAPPMAVPAGSVLKSALAGGLASGLSTCIMHPLDTMKTQVQASTMSFGDVLSSLPQVGLVGLYRGSIPAILGQFASHGLRTGAFEASKGVLKQLAPELSDLQIQPIASLGSSVLGTAIRIPCEVLKQRLQAGLYPNVGAALVGTLAQDGMQGLFRGTTATLFREVPFYVAGMFIYQQAKKVAQAQLGRQLAPWETLLVGGVSGGLAAVTTTPFDVIKTRMMTGTAGSAQGLLGVGFAVATQEGIAALYKGALPRFFWTAPLGAMSFAGYELAKQAMDKEEEERERMVRAPLESTRG